MQATVTAQREALEKVDAARQAAEAQLESERALRERMMAAATAGNLGALASAGGSQQQQQLSPGVAGSEALPMQSLSATELYTKYVEAHERWRQERLKSRQREIVMEELLVEVEKRAALVGEQQAEYERVKAAYARVSDSLETLAAEKRKLDADASRTSADLQRTERERKALDQQVSDLSQQVTRLVYEVQTLKAGGSATATASAASKFIGGDASDVTTQVLVEFSDVEEMQQQNARLLRINRELALQAEATKAEAEEGLRQHYEDVLKRLSNELEELQRSRQSAEEVMAQVIRQRDTLRQLLQSGGQDLAAARAEYARSMGQEDGAAAPASPQPGGGATPSKGQDKANGDLAQLQADLEEQFKQYKEETAKNQEMLSQEVRVNVITNNSLL